MPERVEVNKTLRGRMNLKGRLFKKTNKFCHKTAKQKCKFATRSKQTQKVLENLIWENLGGPFGKGLGRSGPSWGDFWAHFDCLLGVPIHIFEKHGSKMGSKRPFGWLLNRVWEVSDLFWTLSGAFGRFFLAFKPELL